MNARINDVAGSVEIRLANFEVDDLFSLGFESAGSNQDFKGCFGTQPLHAARELQRTSRWDSHHIGPKANRDYSPINILKGAPKSSAPDSQKLPGRGFGGHPITPWYYCEL